MVDFHGDASLLLAQLERIVATESPPKRVLAIYFGLFESADDPDARTIPALYVSGSTRSVEEPNWACWEKDSWLPANRYLRLPRLADQSASEWEEIEGAVADLLRSVRPSLDRLLGTDRHALAFGWDDGEPRLV